ncbi:MAG TPA: hypothetical protein VNQ79_18675 [Blastocatellia bacterium]|nr:hypothetical protein [Blastocatellia bacterium]
MKKAKPIQAAAGQDEELCSISRLAEYFDLDRATMRRRLDDAGKQPVSARAKEKLYRLSDAEEAVAAADSSDLEAARLRKLNAEIRLKELEFERERGELVYVKDVRDDLQQIFHRLFQRTAVQLPREIASALFKAETSGEMAEILQRSLEKVFNDLRNDHQSYL